MAVLIEEREVAKAVNLQNIKLVPITSLLMSIFSLDKVNKIYEANQHLEGVDFVDAVLSDLNLKVEISPKDLAKIPKEGPFITVSNHPMGGLEGLILIAELAKIRPDVKIMANYLLKKIDPIADYFIPVDPFEGKRQRQNSVGGIKEALGHLQGGRPLCFFPAGEVSTYQKEQKAITDRKWKNGVIRFIRKAEVPVIPIHFSGNSGILFQLLGLIHPNLRTASIPNLLFKKSGEKIVVRVGNAIPRKFIQGFADHHELGRFLRAKTYALDSALKMRPFYQLNIGSIYRKTKKVANPTPNYILRYEIEGLSHRKIFSHQEFDVYIAGAHEIPKILQEIGRLREVTFRAAGEGTNRERDLDEYDLYYDHLFLWDSKNYKVVGAYRLGKGKEIMRSYGKRGFYTSSLFHFESELKPYLKKSIELGRSFVVPEYQKQRFPLFILWKGIVYYLLKNKGYQYLIGPVSISNYYSRMSRSLMVEFIKMFHFNEELAQYVKPKNRFKYKTKRVDTSDLLNKCGKDDLKYMDQLISDIELNDLKMPVLLKKYIKQNARIIGFNVDPNFGKALDGLMMLDLNELPKSTLEDFGKNMEAH